MLGSYCQKPIALWRKLDSFLFDIREDTELWRNMMCEKPFLNQKFNFQIRDYAMKPRSKAIKTVYRARSCTGPASIAQTAKSHAWLGL